MNLNLLLFLLGTIALHLLSGTSVNAQAPGFQQTNLVTDSQAANPALISDPNLVNPWGVSFSPSSAFWVSNNGTGTSTLYNVNPLTNVPTKLGLTVTVPGAGNVTGQSFNSVPAGNFNGDNFLFVSEDGTISGWRGALGTSAEVLQTGSTSNVYKGTAYTAIGANGYLLSANFRSGSIDVLKGNAGVPNLTGTFTDPAIPSGFAPFNIKQLGSTLYVTYAKQAANQFDDLAGPGNGFVSSFDLNGNFLGRVASQSVLNSPWGLAIAPASFGSLAGDLLVGNFGDGRINVYDLASNILVGHLMDSGGTALSIDGLWSLTTGNDGGAGSSNSLFFTAGPNGESNGLFGVIQVVPEPGVVALTGLAVACASLAGVKFRRKRNRRQRR
ncbi:MAG TPA: TIGR03118 family protein [Gemmatales bacterium]|nr:TIGR03118 family protein [Gemmatales bacterium]